MSDPALEPDLAEGILNDWTEGYALRYGDLCAACKQDVVAEGEDLCGSCLEELTGPIIDRDPGDETTYPASRPNDE